MIVCNQSPCMALQMIAGASEAEKKTLHLHGASKFLYLNLNKDDTSYHDYCDESAAQGYRALKNAMGNLGLGNVERAAVLRMLAAILWLGEIKYVVNADADQAVVWDGADVDVVANLLRCPSKELEEALTEASDMQCQYHEQAIEGVTQVEGVLYANAVYTRDALAKALYTRVFNWLLERANAILSQNEAFTTISVLDACGFENHPEDNDFGAFCRNYTNECVQELFNKMHFQNEKIEYESEGVSVPGFRYVDNSDCINLLERHGGVISLIDQESQFTKTNETALINHLNAGLGRDPCYARSRKKRGFQIKHCAGLVHYKVQNFVDCNRDLLPEGVLRIMDSCKCKFLSQLFPSMSNRNAATKISRPVTMASQLKNQLAALFRNISMTTVYFVTCLAPHKTADPQEPVDKPHIQTQLRNSKAAHAALNLIHHASSSLVSVCMHRVPHSTSGPPCIS